MKLVLEGLEKDLLFYVQIQEKVEEADAYIPAYI